MTDSAPSSGRLPDFLLIGGMKCGSTSLHDQLVTHPQLAEPQYKEPGFFSRDERFELGIDWYRSIFASATDDQLLFESSTCYTRHPHFGDVAARIHEHLPDIKLIYIMRHPVDRLYSHYRHAMLEGAGNRTPVISLDAALASSDEYFDTGCYLRQIEQFTEHYPRDRFFFLTLHELKTDPDAVLGELQRFLGLDVVEGLGSKKGPSNQIKARATSSNASGLKARLQRNPLVRLVKQAVPVPVRARIMRTVMDSPLVRARMQAKTDAFMAQLSPLSDAKRAELLVRYEAPNRALADFLGRDLPDSWAG
ncbi:MAG: sulfotransferase domain-containing protein [Myxococcota bacterium]